jgi:hypothetical protein
LNNNYHFPQQQHYPQQMDVFQQFLFKRSIEDMKTSFTIPNDSIFFSKIISVRLIKSLIHNSLTQPLVNVNESQHQGILLPQIYAKLSFEGANARRRSVSKGNNSLSNKNTSSDSSKSIQSNSSGMVGIMKELLFGKKKFSIIISLLPSSLF